MSDAHRGHPISLVGDTWVYSDTREPVADNPSRACATKSQTEAFDVLYGMLPGASSREKRRAEASLLLLEARAARWDALVAESKLWPKGDVAGAVKMVERLLAEAELKL